MLLILQPGDIVWPVTPGEEAVTQVSATNVTIFGLISFALYKLFGKKKTEEKKEVQAEDKAETEIDELINSIE